MLNGLAGFVGFIPLEQTLHFPVLTVNGSDVPTDSDAVPSWIAYSTDMSNSLLTGNSVDISGVDGAYRISIACTTANGFAVGNVYTVLVSYAMTSSARRQSFTFMVI